MSKAFEIPDLDMDMSMATREDLLSSLVHIPASKISEKGIVPHGIGVYFCDIPEDRISGLASIDYKRAEEEYGYIKFDMLHNSIYDYFDNRSQLLEILDEPIDWNILYDEKIVQQLPHIGNYYQLLREMPKITSIENLARFIAIIRPGKKPLISIVKNTYDWSSIDDTIWVKPEDNGYYYKHSHAISYALSITVAMKALQKGLDKNLGNPLPSLANKYL